MENSNSNNNHNNYKNNKNIPGGGEAQSANQPLFPAATTATGNLIFDQNSRDSMQIIQMSPLPAPPSSSSSSSTIIPTAAALDSDSDSDPNLDTSHSHQLLMAWPPLLSGCGVDALAPVSAGERMQEGEELPNHHHLQLLHEYNLQQQQQQQQDADSSSSSSSTPVVADDDDATDQDDHAMMLLATHATSAAEAGVDNLDSNEQQQQQPNPDHQVVVYYDQTAYGKCMQTEIRRILSYKNKFDVSEPDYRRLLINYSDSRWDEVYIEQLDRPTLKRRRPVLFDQPQQLQPSNLQRYHDQMMVFEGSGNQEQQQHLFLHQQHVMKKPRTDNYMESDQQVSLLDSSSSTTFELNNTMVATDTSTSASIAATTGNGIEDADIIDEAASASSISWGAYVSVLMQGGEDEYDDKEGGDKDDEDDESDIDDIDHHDTDDGDDTIPSSSFPSSSDSSTDTVLASSNTPSSSSSVMDLYLAPYARLDLLNMDDGCSAHHKGRFTKRDIGYDHKLSFESYLRNSRESLVAMYQNRINSIRRQIVKVHQQAYTFPSPLPTPSPPLLSNTTDHQDHHNHPSDDSSNVSDMNDYSISNEALSTTPLCDTNPPSASTSSSCTAPLLGIDDTNTPSTASSFPAFVCNIDDTTSDENSNNNNNENMDTLSSAQIDHHYPQQHHHHFQQDIIIPDSCGSVNAPSDTKPCTMPVACLLEHTRQLEENAQQSLQQQHQNDFQQQQQHQENYYPHDQQQQVVMHQYSPLPSDESSLPATTEAHPPSPPPNQEQQQQFHHQQQQQQHQQQQQLSPTHPHTTPVTVNGIVKYLDQQTLSYIQSLEIQIFRLSQKMQAITYCLASSASSSLSSSSAMNCEGGGEGGGGDHASIEAAGLDLLGFKQQQQRLDETSSGCVQLQQQE